MLVSYCVLCGMVKVKVYEKLRSKWIIEQIKEDNCIK